MANETAIPLRPHHGMCLAFFEGKGYSDVFTAHMAQTRTRLAQGRLIQLCCHADAICAHCPHNKNGRCESDSKVYRYDTAVLQACGLDDGANLSYAAFSRLVKKNILDSGRRRQICGDCEWDALCAERQKEDVSHPVLSP